MYPSLGTPGLGQCWLSECQLWLFGWLTKHVNRDCPGQNGTHVKTSQPSTSLSITTCQVSALVFLVLQLSVFVEHLLYNQARNWEGSAGRFDPSKILATLEKCVGCNLNLLYFLSCFGPPSENSSPPTPRCPKLFTALTASTKLYNTQKFSWHAKIFHDRHRGSLDFWNKTWSDYKNGFGSFVLDFWFGKKFQKVRKYRWPKKMCTHENFNCDFD